jgi:peptidoglycan/xylan/chitin deacetylase (PgdA/CDA1 family)
VTTAGNREPLIKKTFINALTLDPLLSLGSKLYDHKIPIFMLHRMECAELGVKGHAPALLRFSLEFLRKHKFNIVTTDDVAHAVNTQNPLPPKSVAFTLDDGYLEQVDIATNIFAEYDCPATFYVCTGFVDGDSWFWADKTQFIVENCNALQLTRLMVMFPGLVFDNTKKSIIASHIIEILKNYTLDEINKLINSTAVEVGIHLPTKAPEKYRATSWSSLRAIEKRGMMSGAHTYSHPILSNESDEVSKAEIERSTLDINTHLQNPSKVFCYPVGRQQDFSQREIDYVKSMGYLAAISSIPGSMNVRAKENLFSIPRFSFPDTKEDFMQYATWIESFKSQFRPR